jgi:hypothetical protein
MQHLQGVEKEPQERTSRGYWYCGEMAHHAWKCPLPEDWKKFWCKYNPTKKWETEGFAKVLAELRKKYLKQEGGRWTIVGERTASGESKPSAPRRSGRQDSKKMQIAAVSAPERTIMEARAVPLVSEMAAAAVISEKKAGMGSARSGNQQISFGMVDIATSSSSDGFEIVALGHGVHVLAQVVLTTAGNSAPVGDEIKASWSILERLGVSSARASSLERAAWTSSK